MDKLIPLFKLRLISGQSVGPKELRRLWSRACATDEVSVSREVSPARDGGRPRYFLHGSARIENIHAVEERLRTLLAEAHLTGSINPLHTSETRPIA